MLAHGFYPVQPETVKHGACSFHDTENSNCQVKPDSEEDDGHDDSNNSGGAKRVVKCHLPQHGRKLLVSQRESPEPQVGGSMRDTIQAKLCAHVSSYSADRLFSSLPIVWIV